MKTITIIPSRSMPLALFAAFLLALYGCAYAPELDESASHAAYAMPDKYAARVVEDVLASGGNAVDAAVAAAFTLAVTFPEAGNIGGGGFMLARMDNKNYFLDYREKAPLKAERNMYLDTNGQVQKRASLVGIRAVGVPGTVAGLWEAHNRFGTQAWSDLVAPAIHLAQNGFSVHPKKAAKIDESIEWFKGQTNFEKYFGGMKSASLFKQPDLAGVLKRISLEGPQDFYTGKTASLLLAQMRKEGGLISAQDLKEYQTVWREPLVADWRDYTIVTAPPPSSGGFAVIQLLKMKEFLKEAFSDVKHNSPQYIHLVAEMEKRVFADRAQYFGDPDFVEVPIGTLISDTYIQQRAKQVSQDSISELKRVQPGIESPSTTHFSIVDRWGNAVANTYTLNWGYGSGVVVEGAGFILNNEMDDFSIKPGVKNAYGVVGGTANQIQASKRMLSSMSPTFLLEDNDVRMVLGSPGGSTIFTTVFQTVVNIINFGMSAEEAVSDSRFHHQLLPPDLITMSVEIPLSRETQAGLVNKGYRVEPHFFEFGDVQLIENISGVMNAASDPRGIGVSSVLPFSKTQLLQGIERSTN